MKEKEIQESKNAFQPSYQGLNNSYSLAATLENPINLESGFFKGDSLLNLR